MSAKIFLLSLAVGALLGWFSYKASGLRPMQKCVLFKVECGKYGCWDHCMQYVSDGLDYGIYRVTPKRDEVWP